MVFSGHSSWDPKECPTSVAASLPHRLCMNNHICVRRVSIELIHKLFRGRNMCWFVYVCVCSFWERGSRKKRTIFEAFYPLL